MAPISDCVAARRHIAFWDQDGLGAFLDGVFLRRRTASEVTVAKFAMRTCTISESYRRFERIVKF